jgi:predicted nucleic acid-binding protein
VRWWLCRREFVSIRGTAPLLSSDKSRLRRGSKPVETHFLWRPQLRDPNDEMVLEAAVNGRADALVTFNLRDFGTAPARFGVEALLPREAIARNKR